MMKSQVPLPAVFLNESCSWSQEHVAPYSAEPWLQGLTCTGLPAGTGPSYLVYVGGAGTAHFPREINRKRCYVSRPTSTAESPGRSWTGSDGVLQFKQPTIASSTARAASRAKPAQLHASDTTSVLRACSTSLTQSSAPNQQQQQGEVILPPAQPWECGEMRSDPKCSKPFHFMQKCDVGSSKGTQQEDWN